MIRILGLAGILYLLLLVAVYLFQRSLLYFPTHRDVPPHGAASFEPWAEKDGEFLGYVRDAPVARRVVVVFHGNGGEALDRTWFGTFVPATETVLVLAEYPGYGAKVGKPSEAALVAAGRRVVALAAARWKAPVTVVGESLGTGVACAVADERGVDRLALISPFHAVADLGADRYPFLPVRLLMKDPFRSYQYLRLVSVPLQIIHGTADDAVPFTSGEQLFASYGGKSKVFTAVPGAAHNDMAAHLLQDPVADGFRRFVRGD